ncbi:MAG: SDR family NAD(P)-dependent oxidoreductase [Mesorhizobium sp.]|nr:MAG: SDR family NAD(P)-dependent oxidoreductase [Mesorhizobium sp.]
MHGFCLLGGPSAADEGAWLGRILNTASTLAFTGEARKSAYVASKHGILGLTREVALEGAQLGITCNAVCPWLGIDASRHTGGRSESGRASMFVRRGCQERLSHGNANPSLRGN